MVQTASLFNQLLHHFPRTEFAALVKESKAERHARGFTCWGQFVSMLFCHLAQADSLRLICNGLSCCLGKLKHLGISAAPSKSGLAYANKKRPAALFQQLFWKALERFRQQSMFGPSQKPFRFKNKLLLLDSTTISLCLSLFPWAQFKKVKGGVKAHVLLDHDDYMPRFVHFTGAFHSDVQAAHRLPVQRGSIIVMDRAYIDYDLWAKWITQGMFFVTRLRQDLKIELIEERALPQKRNILRDQLISLSSIQGQTECPFPLRRIEVWNPDKQETIVLLTNQLNFGASTIADIYRQRWQIGVSSQGHFIQSVRDRPRLKDSSLVAWEAPWRESKTVEPSDNILRKECAQRTRLQRAVNADVASLHAIRWLRRSIYVESSKGVPKGVRYGSPHRRGISGDMV